MYKDPIVEEIHEIRRKHAASFNNDLHAICASLRKDQATSGHTVVSLKPRRPRDSQRLLAVAEEQQPYGK